jgi:hypothetical protein
MATRLRWAKRVFLGLVLALGGYEGYALWTPEAGDTISEQVWAAQDGYRVVTFLGGFLCGHFFWPRVVTVGWHREET